MDHISEIKKSINIVELAGNHMGLNPIKRGGHYFIKSIYKDDKDPSLCLYKDENRFFDFSANEGGDLIDFYKDFYHVDLSRAIEDLCRICNISYSRSDTPREKPSPAGVPGQPLVKAFDSGLFNDLTKEEKNYFNSQIKMITGLDPEDLIDLKSEIVTRIKSAESKIKKALQLKRLQQNKIILSELYYYCILEGWDQSALLYLTEKRGIPLNILERFKIFTIGNYNKVNNHMKKVFSLEQLQKSGLYNKKPDGSGNLIFFQHRIIIPHLYNNDIIYLRGRFFDMNGNEKTDTNKYIGLVNDKLGVNSPKRFFNTDIIKNMLPNEKIYVVEGELDTITVETLGFNSIGIPGVGNIPDEKQFLRLKDYDVISCVDNDSAGQKLLTGKYIDKNGDEKYSDKNLIKIFKSLGKDLKIKKLPTKDVNDFLVKDGK